MKHIKSSLRILVVLLMVTLTLILLPTVALAASNTQDGLTVALTTDKTGYTAGDTVTVTVVVTNNNSFAVSNVNVELTLPNGLKLKSGETSVTIGTLAAGEAKEINLTATVLADVPQTGDNSSALFWIVVLLASVGGIAALQVFRKKIYSGKLFSLFLCFVLVLSVMSPVAFAETTQKSFSVDETVKVAGVNKTITAKVTYDWNEPPMPYSVTVENDGNGTGAANPNPAAQGETVTLSATPNSGYQFKEWQIDSVGVTLSRATANPATFTMPGNAVAVKAIFEKAIPAFTITIIYEGEMKIFTNGNADDLSRYTEAMSTTDSYGTVSNYSFTGVRLRDVLQLVGIPVNAFPAGTTIHAVATDGAFTDIALDLIKSDKTLLAWEEDENDVLPPRLCPGDSDDSSLYLKKINTLTINTP